MNKISTQDRKTLIRLASSMPVGSAERRAVLAGLSKTSGIEEQYLGIFAKAVDKYLDVWFDKNRSIGGYVGFEGSRMGRHVIRLSSPRPGKMLVEREWSPDVNDFEEERIVVEADPDDFAPEKKWLTGDLQRDLRTLKEMFR